jgi:hypothetical protein
MTWTAWLALALAVLPPSPGSVRAPLVMSLLRREDRATADLGSDACGRTHESSRANHHSEKDQLGRQTLGQDAYQLISVADFVDTRPETIGDRGAI